ncbi:transposase [Pseudogracilibacillus sp. SO30301A]
MSHGTKKSIWAKGYFCATVGTVTEEIIRNNIANQFAEGNGENFKIDE